MNSNLSDPKYGFDLVVATTQASINATMKTYLDSLGTKDTWIIQLSHESEDDSEPKLEYVTIEDFRKRCSVDLYTIKDTIRSTKTNKNSTVDQLDAADFKAAVHITLGIPGNYDADNLAKLPDMVDLQGGASSVLFRMYSENIRIMDLSHGKTGIVLNVYSQNKTPNKAWVFQSKVDIRLEQDAKFGSLPKEVQEQIRNLGTDMFSIKQLLFDLSNATLATVPEIVGIPDNSPALPLLTTYFVRYYFKHMQDQGQPILGVTAGSKKPMEASLVPTDFNFVSGELNDKQAPANLRTLNYLCSIKDKVPSPRSFDWDWITRDDFQQKRAHGVISVNRNAFRNLIVQQIEPIVIADCFVPEVSCTYKPGSMGFEFMVRTHPTVKPTLTTAAPSEDYSNKIFKSTPESGSLLAEYGYRNQAQDASSWGGTASVLLQQDVGYSVMVKRNHIIICSSMKIFVRVTISVNENKAYIVAKTFEDDYELGVDSAGKMVTKLVTTSKDDSSTDRTGSLWNSLIGDVNGVFDALKAWQPISTPFKHHELSNIQNFVFPGGKTFAFKEVQFSEKQDLISYITYADPTKS